MFREKKILKNTQQLKMWTDLDLDLGLTQLEDLLRDLIDSSCVGQASPTTN